MEYLEEILRLLTWPAVILLSYFISVAVLKANDKFLPKPEDEQE